MADAVKISVNLPRPVVDALKEMAATQNTTVTEMLRKAISTEKFLLDATSRDAKILIEEKDKTMKQVVFRD